MYVKSFLIIIICIAVGIGIRNNLANFFIFHPTKNIHHTPIDIGLDFEDISFTTEDNELINAWYIKAKNNKKNKTLLFLHGNAGNISDRLDSIFIFNKLGLDVFIIDYRGYGNSTGSPSVIGTIKDAKAAFEYLENEKAINKKNIIVFGRSLGGGVAAKIAQMKEPNALILESTFTSLYDVGNLMFPSFLVNYFLPEDYNSITTIENIKIPLLVIHSVDDEVIPYDFGKKIYSTYKGEKYFFKMSGSHNRGFIENQYEYRNELKNFLEKI